jgi:hypothetical protein
VSLRLVAIVIGFIIGGIMVKKVRKIELKVTKRYFMGALEFFFVYSICRTLFLLGSLIDDPLRISYFVGNTLGLVSIVLIIAAIESTIFTKSKHFFTVYGMIGIGVMIFDTFARIEIGGYTLVTLAQYSCMIPLGVIILLIYLRVTLKSTGTVRKNALIMFLGILLLMLSEMGNTGDAVRLIGDSIYYISPIILVGSLILLYYSITHFYSTD